MQGEKTGFSKQDSKLFTLTTKFRHVWTHIRAAICLTKEAGRLASTSSFLPEYISSEKWLFLAQRPPVHPWRWQPHEDQLTVTEIFCLLQLKDWSVCLCLSRMRIEFCVLTMSAAAVDKSSQGILMTRSSPALVARSLKYAWGFYSELHHHVVCHFSCCTLSGLWYVHIRIFPRSCRPLCWTAAQGGSSTSPWQMIKATFCLLVCMGGSTCLANTSRVSPLLLYLNLI